jgi:hypothetical protein
MAGHSTGVRPGLLSPRSTPLPRRALAFLGSLGAGVLARLLGTADGETVGEVAFRELSLILRSREWHRFLGMWVFLCATVFAVPILYRSDTGRWRSPTGPGWLLLCGYALQLALAYVMAQWTIRRLHRDLYTDRLDELMLTRCSPADLATGEALAAAVASLWLVAAAFPTCLLLSGMAGHGVKTALLLALSLAPAGGLGVWIGMGWGLAFTLRRPGAAISPITDWWIKGAVVGPAWFVWAALIVVTTLWVALSPFPEGTRIIGWVAAVFRGGVEHVFWHWNPLLVVWAVADIRHASWLTDWLVLVLILLFMMRKSMDSVHVALGALPERDVKRGSADYWMHHDVHYFMQFGEETRRQPQYRDGGNPVAAFDVALGHRVYLHPFFWSVAFMAYLFMLGWSLLVPPLGLGTGIAAVLIPATGALLLMSGGVAVSFGWERDQHRWPALSILPISNLSLAMGKIKGVVRPTLWINLAASLTALLLGWRGALQWEASLWMALHVLVFPVALACVAATLALTTSSLGEALYRWAVLGAIPTLATLLPPPLGGETGMAVSFSPPLLVLILVVTGPTPGLVRAAWISLGLEIAGIFGSLLILALFLRSWTVGEKD